ncbi:MAG: HAD family hydrolase [Candidatus Omnitrophica bacterium]|nr:HAD family hydrolase [Candidatus Omnitrophota bacterium]MCA9447458.1 HAD family hydrolase [Candidatus Omnitrophota bacterium]
MVHFKAIIFDLDGTLLVSNIDFKGIRSKLGVPEGESVLDFLDDLEESDRKEGHAFLNAVERQAALGSIIHEGVEELFSWLNANRIRHGILTRNTKETWDIIVSRFPFLNPDLLITRNCAPPKPKPESLSPFLEKWRVKPPEIVHVGDYLYDLELAEATGMHSVLMNDLGENPFPTPCDGVVRNHAELMSYLETLEFQNSE